MAAALRNALDGLDREEGIFFKRISSEDELVASFAMHKKENFTSWFLKL